MSTKLKKGVRLLVRDNSNNINEFEVLQVYEMDGYIKPLVDLKGNSGRILKGIPSGHIRIVKDSMFFE